MDRNKKIAIWIIIIFAILAYNMYNPFLTSNAIELYDKVKTYTLGHIYHQAAKNDIHDIEEESLRRVNSIMGGTDEVNATSKHDYLVRPSIQEGFGTDTFELQLFYKSVGCEPSRQFLPIWYEITSALPKSTNISYREFNCDKLNANGITICAAPYNISAVPTLKLKKTTSTGVESTLEFTGARSYKNISQWLASNGLVLTFNMNMETFGDVDSAVSVQAKEKFADANTGITGSVGNMILSAEGNLRKDYDAEWMNAAAQNEFGEYHDVADGCYLASFSKCNEGTRNPGFQIFTHRGQYGCVYPDKNTGIATDFDAAFTVADQYLSSCVPPKFDADTGKEIPMTPGERRNQMAKCAIKYRNQLRSFGLCDEGKLNAKYTIPKKIKEGSMRTPLPDMTAEDYQGAADSAAAIYTACSV
jgi:hypothetical protein